MFLLCVCAHARQCSCVPFYIQMCTWVQVDVEVRGQPQELLLSLHPLFLK